MKVFVNLKDIIGIGLILAISLTIVVIYFIDRIKNKNK